MSEQSSFHPPKPEQMYGKDLQTASENFSQNKYLTQQLSQGEAQKQPEIATSQLDVELALH